MQKTAGNSVRGRDEAKGEKEKQKKAIAGGGDTIET